MTDLRLVAARGRRSIDADTRSLIERCSSSARASTPPPDARTTHRRAAQPMTLGHHLCAHAWALTRDLDGSRDWSERASVSPLGAGALATSTLGLDAAATAGASGSTGAFANSLDAVSDRDVVQEFLAVAAILATHASRLAADLARWTDPTLGWAELDEAYATGSSMMPQKRNPDSAELASGRRPRGSPATSRPSDVRPAGAAARLPPRPAGGQGAGVRRRGHAGARAAGPRRRRPDDPVRRGGDARRVRGRRASTRRIWPRRSCARACRSARPIDGPGSCLQAARGRGPEPRRPHRRGVGGVRAPRRRRAPRPGPIRPGPRRTGAARTVAVAGVDRASCSCVLESTAPRHGAVAARRFRARSSPARTRRAPPAR